MVILTQCQQFVLSIKHLLSGNDLFVIIMIVLIRYSDNRLIFYLRNQLMCEATEHHFLIHGDGKEGGGNFLQYVLTNKNSNLIREPLNII